MNFVLVIMTQQKSFFFNFPPKLRSLVGVINGKQLVGGCRRLSDLLLPRPDERGVQITIRPDDVSNHVLTWRIPLPRVEVITNIILFPG
jgi:hypothetical protein